MPAIEDGPQLLTCLLCGRSAAIPSPQTLNQFAYHRRHKWQRTARTAYPPEWEIIYAAETLARLTARPPRPAQTS